MEWKSIAGVRVKNPVMLAAGILGETYGSLKRVEREGAGALVTKSIGVEPNPGYRSPIVVETTGGLLNAVGLSNPGYKAFRDDLSEGMSREPFQVPIIASVYGSSPGEFCTVIRGLEEVVDGFELNLSCPHSEKYGQAVGSDPETVEDVVRSCKSCTEKPVIAKLSPNVSDLRQIARAAERGGADAICAINSVGPGMVIQPETMRPVLSNKFGGLSGPCIKPIAIRCIYEIYEEVEIPIIGVGGVEEAMDAVEMMEAGATWVQVGTAVYRRGYGVFREIARGIERFLAEHSLSHSQIIGAAHGG